MRKRENIYIIPTRYGLLYGVGVLTTLSAGAIYGNNLVYLLCFFLVALILIGMVQTHSNLKELTVSKLALELSPANSQGNGKIWFHSKNSEGHNQILVENIKSDEKFKFNIEYMEANGLSIERFAFNTDKRGKKEIHKIKVSSTFPFGLFYAWRFYKIDTVYYIYPKPVGREDLPDVVFQGESIEVKSGHTGDDFTQHRKYQVGESQKHIDWKAFARGRPLLVKEFKDGERSSLTIDIDKMKGAVEDRLAQMTKWIEECETRKIVYGVLLKDIKIMPGLGYLHRDQCLRALAEYKTHDAA